MKLLVTRDELYQKYSTKLDEYLDDLDWVTYIDAATLCQLMCGILHEIDIEVEYKILYNLYTKKVEDMDLGDGEWHLQYGNDVPKIINLIYDLIEEKL